VSVEAIFEGGPADGTDMALIGRKLPPYLMLMSNPNLDSMAWLVVGAGFDDHWPGQHRYEIDLSRTHVLVSGGITSGEAVYVYADG
jgi:hypothetical protein